MKLIFIVFFLFFTVVSFSQKGKSIKVKKGKWNARLELNNSDVLPFKIKVKKKNRISIINAEESIDLDILKVVNDSIHAHFPYFNSELVFVSNKKSLSGYFVNYNKGKDYKIPFTAQKSRSSRFSFVNKRAKSINLDGNWEVHFEPNSENTYPALGIFNQADNKNSINGTFLTETGDYRFLEGNTTDDSLYLSCFDGSHAFLFKAKLENDSLYGKFFSGSHWQSEWNAKRNENFKLKSPEELTYLKEDQSVKFDLPTLSGDTLSFPNSDYKDKVVIIQIMGTWCPNCLDESIYYKELHDRYHSRGLEIISVCYEAGKSFDEYVTNVTRLKNKLDLDFTFLIGGNASKGLAAIHFNMLNDILSFPTSIYIGRDGEVKRVHTGFNGPGTGEYYLDYKQNTNALIESLLKD